MIFTLNNDSSDLMQSNYIPFQTGSEINFQIGINNSKTFYGSQWWVSDNLALSGIIATRVADEFNLYHNFSLGYYNKNLKWLYSSSNFIEISMHKIKYSDSFQNKWINCSYKSRYRYKNFISGYDLNYYFWKNMENNFITFSLGYNIEDIFSIEFKTNFIKNRFQFNSFIFSVPL